jgi:FHA domain-containing protein
MIGIQIVSWAGAAPPVPTTAWFGPDGGDIGRSAECTLSLPDPDRHISRRHAVVSVRDGHYLLQSLSASVPLVLEGAALAPGEQGPLAAGMRIAIGAYMLQVLDEPDVMVSARGRPAAVPPPQPEPAVDLLIGGTGEVGVAPSPSRPAADWAAALQRGLGVSPGALGPEQAQRAGELLRAMTQGTLELLTARMVAKRELGAAATQLRTRENNPLKFSPDVDAALSHLLGAGERGFLEPKAAVQEAFDDLRAHQVALLAGMRAALDTVMSRFDPTTLEQRLSPGNALEKLENLLPANRRARLWSAYAEEYARIVDEIEDDFDALLGRAFLRAYQAQLEALTVDRKRIEP